jgi:hypothetical protein
LPQNPTKNLFLLDERPISRYDDEKYSRQLKYSFAAGVLFVCVVIDEFMALNKRDEMRLMKSTFYILLIILPMLSFATVAIPEDRTTCVNHCSQMEIECKSYCTQDDPSRVADCLQACKVKLKECRDNCPPGDSRYPD